MFNGLVRAPFCLAPHVDTEVERDAEEAEGLLSSPLDETATLPADLGQSGYDVVPDGQHKKTLST